MARTKQRRTHLPYIPSQPYPVLITDPERMEGRAIVDLRYIAGHAQFEFCDWFLNDFCVCANDRSTYITHGVDKVDEDQQSLPAGVIT